MHSHNIMKYDMNAVLHTSRPLHPNEQLHITQSLVIQLENMKEDDLFVNLSDMSIKVKIEKDPPEIP